MTGTAKQVCEQWRPIAPSRSDKLTAGTTTQIAGNNAANEAWCGVRPVEKAPAQIASAKP